ncbi:hypothetical protein [Methanothrix sp.]|uniref:hypothetical protein n=1 Tax=Methanothrix sp. TaxID=90426 RepID=UPI00345F0A48
MPGERASRIGHLEVVKSDLVKSIIQSFDSPEPPLVESKTEWKVQSFSGNSLPIIFGIDGSMQVNQYEKPPQKAIAFVKTALLRLDQYSISQIDREYPNPFALRDMLSDSALYHATVFPLRHTPIPGMNTYDAIRQIIFESIKEKGGSLDTEVMETLKWLAYEKWAENDKSLQPFECPHCEEVVASLNYNEEKGTCSGCGGSLFLTDMLGFHQEMAPDSAPDTVATAYMNIHETLLLFTAVRYYWETNKKILSNCLFVKDGPLMLRAQYSKLVDPIRRFLFFAQKNNFPVHIIGQEKTGRFMDHLQLIKKDAQERSIFMPDNKYIKEIIKSRPNRGGPYGEKTNYGNKIFVKLDNYHSMVLNIPHYSEEPSYMDTLDADRIFATIPKILSNRYEGALLPIELAHGVASLSTYPSAKILKIFSESKEPPII